MRPEPSGGFSPALGPRPLGAKAAKKAISLQIGSASPASAPSSDQPRTTQWLLLSLHLRGLKGVILGVVSRELERHSRTFFLSHLVATPRGLQNACVQTATASSFLPLHLCSLHMNFYNFVLRPSYCLEDCSSSAMSPI